MKRSFHRHFVSAVVIFILGLTCACAIGPARVKRIPTPIAATATITEPTATVIKPTVTLENTPVPSPTPPTVDEDAISKMLAYVPAKFADTHLPVAFGPSIYVFDFARMRADLNIPPVTGASSHKEKLDLLTGINTQGLPYLPTDFNCTLTTAYETWGWDIADVDQALYLPDWEISVLSGRFDLSTIQSVLTENASSVQSHDDFEIFYFDKEKYRFAIKADILVLGSYLWEEGDFVQFLDTIFQNQHGLNDHPVVSEIIPGVRGAWGAIFAPSPDVLGFRARIDETLKEFTPEQQEYLSDLLDYDKIPENPAWSFMAISYRLENEQYQMNLQYDYESAEQANQDVDLVRKLWTESPSLTHPGLTISDVITLDQFDVVDNLLIASGVTKSVQFLGSMIESDQEYVFVPIRYSE